MERIGKFIWKKNLPPATMARPSAKYGAGVNESLIKDLDGLGISIFPITLMERGLCDHFLCYQSRYRGNRRLRYQSGCLLGSEQPIHMGRSMPDVDGLVCTVTPQTNLPCAFHQLSSIDLTIHRRNFTLGSTDIASGLARPAIPGNDVGSWSSAQCFV